MTGAVSDERADEVVRWALRDLGVPWPDRPVERLTSGRSGAVVVGLRVGSTEAVLKVTTDPRRIPAAERELTLFSCADRPRRALMPRFLAGRAGHGVVSLLTARHAPVPAAASLTAAAWVELAQSLGTLHRLPVPSRPRFDARPWPSAEQRCAAAQAWSARVGPELSAHAFDLLGDRRDRPAGLDLVLTHGDCHTENLVRDERGPPRWIDWQDACLGDGLEDLVFLWQRAEFAGARPPRVAMTTAYAEGRGIPADAGLSGGLFRAELLLLFVSWPPFLDHGSEGAQRLMGQRVAELVGAELPADLRAVDGGDR